MLRNECGLKDRAYIDGFHRFDGVDVIADAGKHKLGAVAEARMTLVVQNLIEIAQPDLLGLHGKNAMHGFNNRLLNFTRAEDEKLAVADPNINSARHTSQVLDPPRPPYMTL